MSSSSASRSLSSRIFRSAAGKGRTSLLLNKVPSLQEFLHKQKVLHQYRSFLRAIRLIENETERQHAFQEVHREFKTHASLENPLATQMAVTDGERKLQQVQSMVGYSTTPEDIDSWLNTFDPDDPRGRVGTEWPWQR